MFERMRDLKDVRGSKGRRHRLASALTICALATLCGARGTRAIADFAGYLDQRQLRLLRAYRHPKTGRFEAPSEPTIRRMLKNVPAADFDEAIFGWMQEQERHGMFRFAR